MLRYDIVDEITTGYLAGPRCVSDYCVMWEIWRGRDVLDKSALYISGQAQYWENW